MSSLNVKICDIVSDGLYTMSYKPGSNPCPTNSSFTTIGTGLTASTITLTGLTFNTQYWVKMTDESSNRYIIRNISTNHSKTYPCYDTMCFNVVTDCDEPTPTPTITPTPTPPCCSQWTYYFSGSTSGVNIFIKTVKMLPQPLVFLVLVRWYHKSLVVFTLEPHHILTIHNGVEF
jgi:hypothetical protein